MKYLLVFFLSTGLFNANSQPQQSISEINLTPFILTSGEIEHKEDTVKVVMLVCDTIVRGGFTAVGFLDPIDRARNEQHSLTWILGYAVRDLTIEKKGNHRSGIYMWYNDTDKSRYSLKYYLDDYKLPLPKTLIVWQAQTIK